MQVINIYLFTVIINVYVLWLDPSSQHCFSFINSIVCFVFEIGSLLVEKMVTLYIRTTFSGFYEWIRRRYTTLILMLIFLRIWTNTKPHFEKRCGGGIREAFDMVAQDNMWRYSVDIPTAWSVCFQTTFQITKVQFEIKKLSNTNATVWETLTLVVNW